MVFDHEDDKPEKAMDEEARRKDGPIQPFIPRQIDFLHFHNVSKDQAEKMLADKEDGIFVTFLKGKIFSYLRKYRDSAVEAGFGLFVFVVENGSGA